MNNICTEETRNKNALGQQDHFLRLPMELFVYILGMVADLKSLFLCSLVSKRFASLVTHVRSVYVTIPMTRCRYKSLIDVRQDPKLKPLIFLEKFSELEYIFLEYKPVEDQTCRSQFRRSPFATWKIKFGTDFPRIDRFVAFMQFSIDKKTGNESLDEQTDAELLRSPAGCDCFGLLYGYGLYADWMYVISMLGKTHMSLKGVSVTDSAKAGKMVVGNEQLVRLRSLRDMPAMFKHMRIANTVRIPVLNLPLSGYVMRRVILIIHNNPTKSGPRVIDELLSLDFEDEEKVLGEVVKEICKNHRDKITQHSY